MMESLPTVWPSIRRAGLTGRPSRCYAEEEREETRCSDEIDTAKRVGGTGAADPLPRRTPIRRTSGISNRSSPGAESSANAGGFRSQGAVARVRADTREVHFVHVVDRAHVDVNVRPF